MVRPLACSVLAIALVACTYDWTEGPRDGAVTDGTGDAAPPGEGGDCGNLGTQVNFARTMLLSCQTSCAQNVLDACGCHVAVEDANSQAAQNYVAAVAAFKMAGCVPDCSMGCTVLNQCFRGGDGGHGYCI